MQHRYKKIPTEQDEKSVEPKSPLPVSGDILLKILSYCDLNEMKAYPFTQQTILAKLKPIHSNFYENNMSSSISNMMKALSPLLEDGRKKSENQTLAQKSVEIFDGLLAAYKCGPKNIKHIVKLFNASIAANADGAIIIFENTPASLCAAKLVTIYNNYPTNKEKELMKSSLTHFSNQKLVAQFNDALASLSRDTPNPNYHITTPNRNELITELKIEAQYTRQIATQTRQQFEISARGYAFLLLLTATAISLGASIIVGPPAFLIAFGAAVVEVSLMSEGNSLIPAMRNQFATTERKRLFSTSLDTLVRIAQELPETKNGDANNDHKLSK